MADSKHREHNQGNQSRAFTPEQKSAVDRVRRCKATDYYAILDIERTVSEGEIKKAYRRLALVMHPDKNGAPGADEAFKLVSKAFQVLSEPDKRAQYDKFGGDPDSRGGGSSSSSSFAGGPFAGGGPYAGRGAEMTPEELFNAFFGGGFGGGPFGGGGFGGPFAGGEFVSFGPGIRVQTFGGGPRQRRRPAANGEEHEHREPTAAEQEASLRAILLQLAPLLFLFILPIIMSLWSEFFGEGAGMSNIPDVRFEQIHPFTTQRTTPRHHIRYWVNSKDMSREMTDQQLREMDKRVETRYVAMLQKECRRERVEKQEEIDRARGWIFEDRERMKRAEDKPLLACRRLGELGEQRMMS